MILQYQLTIGLVKDKVQTQRVLEIGSAKGYLLAILKAMGWDVFGIEISATATQFARKQFGISSFTGTLEKYVDQNTFEKFPLVLALDLIEHVPDPDDFLSKVNQVTAKGGYLIIVTPNGGSDNLDTLNSNWSGFNPFHINIFSKDNLAVLLLKHGFQIEKVFSYNNARLSSSPDYKTDKPDYFDSFKNLAKKLQLFNFLKDIRFVLWQQLDALHRNDYLKQTIDQIQIQPDYFSTADSRDELAKDCKGDNMVLILKKIE
ncbi:class I SAM-dependent methyltransferase [candidate division KSB1 bacterium]|nr:class I SAM-dependent methyltransferase [candidate division KSB1 bacterium]